MPRTTLDWMALPTLLTDGIAVGYPGRLALLQHFWLPQGTKNTSRTKPLRSVAKEKLNICVCTGDSAAPCLGVSPVSCSFPLDLLLHRPLPVLPAPNSVPCWGGPAGLILPELSHHCLQPCVQISANGSEQLVWCFQGAVAAIGTWQGVQPTAVGPAVHL